MQNWYCALLNEMKTSKPADFDIHFILCVSSMNLVEGKKRRKIRY